MGESGDAMKNQTIRLMDNEQIRVRMGSDATIGGGWAVLYDYKTGEALRLATTDEEAASIAASVNDGGHGVIVIEGQLCYVA